MANFNYDGRPTRVPGQFIDELTARVDSKLAEAEARLTEHASTLTSQQGGMTVIGSLTRLMLSPTSS